MSGEELARLVAEYADDKKAQDVVELDLRGVVGYTDYFVICTGATERQVKAIHDGIHLGLKDDHGLLPRRVEGLSESRWVLMDYLDVVVHVFTPQTRSFYRLEQLWGEAPSRETGSAEPGPQRLAPGHVPTGAAGGANGVAGALAALIGPAALRIVPRHPPDPDRQRGQERDVQGHHGGVGASPQPARDVVLLLALEQFLVVDERARELRLCRDLRRRDRRVARHEDREGDHLAVAVDAQGRLPVAVDRDRGGRAVHALGHALQALDVQPAALPGGRRDPAGVVGQRGRVEAHGGVDLAAVAAGHVGELDGRRSSGSGPWSSGRT